MQAAAAKRQKTAEAAAARTGGAPAVAACRTARAATRRGDDAAFGAQQRAMYTSCAHAYRPEGAPHSSDDGGVSEDDDEGLRAGAQPGLDAEQRVVLQDDACPRGCFSLGGAHSTIRLKQR